MLEILKGVISLLMQGINQIFNIDIEITPEFHAKFGMLLISFAFLCILLICVFNALGIHIGKDDE